MANPRQRNKARSHKVRTPSLNSKRRMHQKLRRAPPLKGPEVLQEGWDRKKTVFQNYAALGLLPAIPLPKTSTKSHRASLPFLPPHLRPEAEAAADPSVSSAPASAPKVGFGRIIRDDEGNVVDIIIDEEPESAPAPAGRNKEGMEGDDDEEEEWKGIQEDGDEDESGRSGRRVEAKTDVVRSLEALAATSAPITRHTSTAERTWLHALVAAHGADVDRMARDRTLNVWQKTPGEIGRALKKAGGVDKLQRANANAV